MLLVLEDRSSRGIVPEFPSCTTFGGVFRGFGFVGLVGIGGTCFVGNRKKTAVVFFGYAFWFCFIELIASRWVLLSSNIDFLSTENLAQPCAYFLF